MSTIHNSSRYSSYSAGGGGGMGEGPGGYRREAALNRTYTHGAASLGRAPLA